MVHNGIEYGDMQLIAESYHLLKAIGLQNEEIAETFEKWNRGKDLRSFLIEITAKIFMKKDGLTPHDLIDSIKDSAKQKGTGKWTTESALDLGLMIPTITSAVDARYMSAQKPLRVLTNTHFGVLDMKQFNVSISAIKDALLLSKICSYAQGLAMIAEANRIHRWSIDLAEVCRIWKGGCIIRSTLLKTFEEAFRSNPALQNLLLAPVITELFKKKQKKWRTVIAKAQLAGIPVPSFSASLSYFDSLRSAWLPQNLTQAQRDFFGAHTYERIDKEGVFHTQWSQ
jgi:6-phosphogluconate dehydrogenase